MTRTAFIAIDWGTTNFRAYNIINEQCVDKIETKAGIKQIVDKNFDHTLCELLSQWRKDIERKRTLILMGGMIGSDQGWYNTGYQMLPQTLSQIKTGCIRVESQLSTDIFIKQGIAVDQPNDVNVMRGEEIQLLGATAAGNFDCYLFPGTHSKWVSVSTANQIHTYQTIMTGELFSILMDHSLLGFGVNKQINDTAFNQGLYASIENKDIIEQLFFARAAKVLGHLSVNDVAGWLSGALIGHEISSQLKNYPDAKHFAIVANPQLGKLYQQAFLLHGLNASLLEPEQTIINGFRSIYHALKY